MSTPILIETSEELKEHMAVIAEYLSKVSRVSLYGEAISSSYIAVMSNFTFARDIKAGLVTPDMLKTLEEYYREYRVRDDTVNTNVYFKPVDIDDLNSVVEFLSKTDVRHLYHGKKVNKKMVVMFGLHYTYLLALKDQQG